MEKRLEISIPDSRVDYVAHGQFLTKTRDVSRDEARDELGLPHGEKLFLCIGFLGPQKGFDRAIKASSALQAGAARLYVVGSPLYQNPPTLAYVRRLHALAGPLPQVSVREQYVEDEEFDTWIAASDFVVTPYANAFSSSVAERAKLYERPLIASAVGGLPYQLTARDYVFKSDEDLVQLLKRLSGAPQ